MANDNELNDDQHESITENEVVENPAPPVPPVRNGRVNFAEMTPRERELVQYARQEEKNKLYKDQQRIKEENERLQTQLRNAQAAPTPTTVDGINAQNDRIDKLLTMVESQDRRLSEIQENEIARRRESELRAYSGEAISAMRVRGEDVVEALVGGSNEDEIDESLMIARAEYQRVVMLEDEKRNRANGGRGRSVTVQANGGRPSGAPRPVAPNVVEAEDIESIRDLTSDEAVRNGSYDKNRTKILGKLKRGYKYQSQAQ